MPLLSSFSDNWWAANNSPGKFLCHIELQPNNLSYNVIIDQADPLIWISAEIVSWAATGQASPRITFTPQINWAQPRYYIGSVLRFHGDNLDVLYQLTKWHDSELVLGNSYTDLGYYVAEWPD